MSSTHRGKRRVSNHAAPYAGQASAALFKATPDFFACIEHVLLDLCLLLLSESRANGSLRSLWVLRGLQTQGLILK